MFVDKIDEDTVAEIAEQVYNNEDQKEIEETKRQIKRRAARGYRPATAGRAGSSKN